MSKKSHKALASATVMSLILTSTLTATVSAATGVERLSGSNRETTAIDVATKVFEKAETVVLVNGYKSADALSATPLAKAYNAPILSVGAVDEPTAALTKALKDLGAKKVIVVGGEGAVTKALAAKLAETYTVERIEGKDRYATNVAVAEKVKELKASKEAFVVNGSDASYADALSIASIAASKGAPIVFTNGKTVSDEAKALVKDLKVTAIGGTGVVSADVLAAVDATRVGGSDRFETNLEVLKAYKDVIKLDNVFVAYGLNFADALVASAAAAKTDAPVVLADKTNTKFTKGATDYIEANKAAIKNVYLVGGTGVIADSVKNTIDGIVNPVATDLKVESVTALNGKQVKIVFNKEVDKKTAETVTNYAIAGVTIADTGNDASVAKLQEDGKTVILTIDNNPALNVGAELILTNQSKYNVTIKNVKDTFGNYLNEVTFEDVQVIDTTAPIVKEIKVTGPKTFKIIFSEPVNPANANFLIDNGSVGYSNVIGIPSENALEVTASADLASGEHTVVVNNSASNSFVDYAGIVVVKSEQKFILSIDNTAPTVSVKSASPDKITLLFNKPVKDLDNANNEVKVGYSTIATGSITAKNGSVYEGETYASEWEIALSNPIAGGSVGVTVDNDATAKGDQILDKWGNKFVTTTVTANIVADTLKPAVESIEVKSDKQFVVKFNKEVTTAHAENRLNYVLYNNKGEIVKSESGVTDAYGYLASTTTFNYDNTRKEVTITLSGSLSADNYSIKVSGIKDRVSYNQQTIEAKTLSFNVADKTLLQLSDATLTGRKITLTFTKSVATTGEGSALNVANYKIDGAELPSGSSAALGGSDKIVVITVGGTAPVGGRLAAAIKDAKGNMIDVAVASQLIGSPTIASTDVQNIKLIDDSTITFEVKKAIKSLNISGIQIADNVNVVSGSFVNQNIKVGSSTIYGAVVTLKVASESLATELGVANEIAKAGGTADITDSIKLPANAIETIEGARNLAFDVQGIAKDYAAPVIKTIKTFDNTKNGMIDTVVVEYSEAISSAEINRDAFTVNGYIVKNAYVTAASNDSTPVVAGKYVQILVEESGKFDTDKVPTVKQVVDVKDVSAQANIKKADTSANVITTDAAGPAIVSTEFSNGGATITVVFSEKVADSSIVVGDFVLAGTGVGAHTIASFTTGTTANDNTIVLNLDSATTVASGQNLTLAIANAGDISDTNSVVSTQTVAVTVIAVQ